MEIVKIAVTDLIMAEGLFSEDGYDLDQRADNLAELKWNIIMGYLEEQYPEVEVYVVFMLPPCRMGSWTGKGPAPLFSAAYTTQLPC